MLEADQHLHDHDHRLEQPVQATVVAVEAVHGRADVHCEQQALRPLLMAAVARILVAEGDEITEGQVLLVLEAMKMETEITAPAAGKVVAVLVKPGDAVQGGQALIEL